MGFDEPQKWVRTPTRYVLKWGLTYGKTTAKTKQGSSWADYGYLKNLHSPERWNTAPNAALKVVDKKLIIIINKCMQ